MSFLFHPVFQSVVLPLMLAIAFVAALRAVSRPWAGTGAVLALLCAFAVLPGYAWPADSVTQRLPWLVLGTAFLCALARTLQRTASTPGDAGASHAAAWVMATLGLTALAGLGGSLLLAQIALMVAVTIAVPGVWAWLLPRSGVRVDLWLLLPMAVATFALARALPATGLPGVGRLLLLALALSAPWWIARTRWAEAHPRLTPLLVVALAALPVGAALVWLLLGSADAPLPGAEDPYFEPDWNRAPPKAD